MLFLCYKNVLYEQWPLLNSIALAATCLKNWVFSNSEIYPIWSLHPLCTTMTTDNFLLHSNPIFNKTSNKYSTRSMTLGLLSTYNVNTTYGSNSFKFCGTSIFNNISYQDYYKNSKTKQDFVYKYKDFLSSNY